MKSRGFTLIELLVSVIILLLLTGILVAGYNGFNGSQLVIQAAATLKVNLSRIRTQASSGQKPTPDLNNPNDKCDQLVGYQVDFSTTTYTTSARCVVGGEEKLFGPTQTTTLPKGVTFCSSPVSTIFYALDRGVSTPEILTLTSFNKIISVQILASGSVADYVPAVPCTNP